MLERIVFLFCSIQSAISLGGLLQENRDKLLSEHGILFPEAKQNTMPKYYSHDVIVAKWGEYPVLSESCLYTVLRDMETTVLPHTLIIKVSSPRWPEVNCLLYETFKKLYPMAVQYAVLVCSRQDMQFEAYTASLMMRHMFDVTRWIDDHEKQYPLYYCRYVRQMLNAFGRDAVLWIMDDGTGEVAFQIQKRVLCLAGVPAVQAEAMLESYVPPPHFLHQSRAFLNFCQAHIALTDAEQHMSAFPWAWEALHIAMRQPQQKALAGLLSPQARRAILQSYADSNAEASLLLNLPYLFPDPDSEPDWEPFLGLTPESAFAVAERLDRDFAAARMAEFDAVPIQYLTREQRLCRAALHDVLDPPSAAPLIRTKADEPKLSVLTLTYNHASFIAECIESVLAQQTDFPIQHIIADDTSDDGTQDIILDYASRHKHIVPVFQKKRSCGPRNVKAMFDLARTEYAALCEGDDYFTDPRKLQIQVEYLDAHPDCALCFHPVRVVYEGAPDKERIYPPVEELPREVRDSYYCSDLAKVNFIQTNSVMYRWRFREGLPEWFHPELPQGDWYWHLLHAEKGKIGFINTIMSVYRRHASAVYILSETNRREHRHKVGLGELHSYHIMNEHFKGRFRDNFFRLADGVISDIMLYARKTGDAGLIDAINDKYPDFADHFMETLRTMKARENNFQRY
jgi:glycosyltransferase involved in cell wall biosynthesis